MNRKQQIIVSLTSFPAAIPYAVQAIRSILAGSVLPDKIVLYLTFSQFGEQGIPQELQELAENNSIFEIRNYDTDIRSYRKLIPALTDFPDDVIVTVDDDIHYHRHLLRDLIRLHKRIPDVIIGHRVRRVKLNAPYRKWRKYHWYDFIFKRIHFSHLAMQTGGAGTLYPPHSLDEKMLDPELFMTLAPTNDDIWFWLAAVSRNTYVVPLPNGQRKIADIGKPLELCLRAVNLKPGDDRNRAAFDRILERFPAIRQKLEEENNKIPSITQFGRCVFRIEKVTTNRRQ